MADVSIEQQILEKLSQLDEAQKRQVLDFVTQSLGERHVYSARELLQLSPDERARLVAAAFDAASDEDFETFEAYSEEDSDG